VKKVLCTSWLPEEVMAAYAGKIKLDCYPVENETFSRAETLAKLPEYDGLFSIRLKVDKEIIDIGVKNKLKVVSNFGVGYDNVDLDYATEVGLPVTNTPIAVMEATAELSIILLMSVMRDIGRIERKVRETRKFCGSLFYAGATSVFGKTLGIVGLGRIGKAVARRAKGLGMAVIYHDAFRASPEIEKEIGITYMSAEDVLRNADAITIHMPLMPETHHYMDAAKFALMKNGAYFVNASRGAVVHEAALIDALKSGKLAGAGLDVYEFEPVISPELFDMENVMLMPHIGSMTWDARVNMARESLDAAVAILNGEIPVNCVNKSVFDR
jgi:glyoxylate reductase